MWREVQSAMRLNVFASISQIFDIQSIKYFQVRRFIIVLYYEAAKHVANIVKRFNIKDFMVKKNSWLVIKFPQKLHLFN